MAVEAAREKKALGLVVLDLKNICNFADFFLICHGTSTRHAQAIADSVEEKLSRNDLRCNHIEGKNLGQWILMDFIDVIVHIFTKEHREFYGLERLWGDAGRVPLPAEKVEKVKAVAEKAEIVEPPAAGAGKAGRGTAKAKRVAAKVKRVKAVAEKGERVTAKAVGRVKAKAAAKRSEKGGLVTARKPRATKPEKSSRK